MKKFEYSIKALEKHLNTIQWYAYSQSGLFTEDIQANPPKTVYDEEMKEIKETIIFLKCEK